MKTPLHRLLYVQVLAAIALGALFGWLAPQVASADWVKALGDGFVKLIKMAIAPIIFCTVVSGVAHIEDARKVGRVGVKALIYFEVVSTFALVHRPARRQSAEARRRFRRKGGRDGHRQIYAAAAKRSGVDFLLDIIPDSAVGAFAKGDILQVLLFSLLFGFALLCARREGARHAPVRRRRRPRHVRAHRHRDEGRAHRRLRRHGLYGRQIWLGRAALARRADRRLLSHLGAVRRRRAGD